MEIINVNGHVLQLFNSIKELPIGRATEARKYLLQDMGIGNNISDVDDHIEKFMLFASRNQPEDCFNEAKNMRFNLFAMIEGLDFKSMYIACLTHSIDNTVFKSPDVAHNALIQLEITGLQAEEWMKTVKKNLILNANYTSRNSLMTLENTLTEFWSSLA